MRTKPSFIQGQVCGLKLSDPLDCPVGEAGNRYGIGNGGAKVCHGSGVMVSLRAE